MGQSLILQPTPSCLIQCSACHCNRLGNDMKNYLELITTDEPFGVKYIKLFKFGITAHTLLLKVKALMFKPNNISLCSSISHNFDNIWEDMNDIVQELITVVLPGK